MNKALSSASAPLRHYLQFSDVSAADYGYLFERTALIKRKFKAYERHQPLIDRTLAMIFEKASTRTRVSFEAGMYQMGGSVVHLTTADSQLGRSEPIEDSAKVISRMVDLIMIRTYEQTKIERFAEHSRVPVINGLTNEFHPCQILADIFTYIEHRGSIKGKTVAWVGDGNNMANTWLQASEILGFKVHVSTPGGYEVDQSIAGLRSAESYQVFNSQHQALPANLLDAAAGKLGLQGLRQGTSEMRANLRGVDQQAFFFHDAYRLHAGTHGQRISAKGGAVVANLEDVGRLRACHDSADRHPGTQPFGKRHHIGRDTGPLVREPLSGAPHAALNLVDHEQPIALVAQLAHRPKVVRVHRMNTAFTLNSLKEDSDDVRIVGGGRPQTVHIVQRHPDEPLHQRTETGLDLWVAGGTQGGDGAPMKRLLVDHDLGPLYALVMTELARQFECSLVGFQPCRAEEHVGHAGELDEFFGQYFLVRYVVVVGSVNQFAQLVLQRRHQFGVVVPQRVDRDATQGVQILLAIDVPDTATLAMREGDRHAPVGVHDVGRSSFNERGGAHKISKSKTARSMAGR